MRTIIQTAHHLIHIEADALDAAHLLHHGRSALAPLAKFFRRHRRTVADAIQPHVPSRRAAQRYAAHHVGGAMFNIREAIRIGQTLDEVAQYWREHSPRFIAEDIRAIQ